MDKDVIEHQLRCRARELTLDNESQLKVWRENKAINDRNRAEMRKATALSDRLKHGLPGLSALTAQMKAGATINRNDMEIERVFMLLSDMGCIPEVSYVR